MSRSRQAEDSIKIRTFAVTFNSGWIIPPHSDDWDQLIYATRGVMSVHTDTGSWVVPGHRAVWVPARIHYSVDMSGIVSMRTLYVAAGLSRSLPRTCCTVNVSPLLRELILHAVRLGPLDAKIPSQSHLISVIVDQLQILPAIPLQLSMPVDARAQRVAKMLREDPGDERPLAQIAKCNGASARTIERIFRAETQMSFGQWRQRLRLLHSLKLLALGESVTDVALELGYKSPSAFIAMFKGELGTTPGSYFHPPRADATFNASIRDSVRPSAGSRC
jgi:AraC-like DNA-binding protein